MASIAMATSTMAPDLGAAAPYGSVAGAGNLVCSRCCQFPCFGRQNRTHQKMERYAGLWPKVAAIWGCKTTFNKKLASSVYRMLKKSCGRSGAFVRTPFHRLRCRTDRRNYNISYIHGGIYQPPIGGPTHLNQPK